MAEPAGALDRQIVILRATTTANAYNEPIQTWSTLATVSASKRDVSDAERVRAGQVGASMTTRFQIRTSPDVADVDPRDQLTCEGLRYQIVAVKEVGRADRLEITATRLGERP